MSDARNMSLDASRDSVFLALLVQGGRYRAATSTQPFGRTIMRLQKLSIVVLLLGCVATAACGCRLAKDEVLKIGRRWKQNYRSVQPRLRPRDFSMTCILKTGP